MKSIRILLILLFLQVGFQLFSQLTGPSPNFTKLDSQIQAIEHAPVIIEQIEGLQVQDQIKQVFLQGLFIKKLLYHNPLGNQWVETSGNNAPNLQSTYSSITLPYLNIIHIEMNSINGVPYFNNEYHYYTILNGFLRYTANTDKVRPFIGIGMIFLELDLVPSEQDIFQTSLQDDSGKKPAIQQKGIIEMGIQGPIDLENEEIPEWQLGIRYSPFNTTYRIYDVYDSRSTIQATFSLVY